MNKLSRTQRKKKMLLDRCLWLNRYAQFFNVFHLIKQKHYISIWQVATLFLSDEHDIANSSIKMNYDLSH